MPPFTPAWKEGEYQYCRALVQTRGDRNVPFRAVQSYLDLQAKSAEKDGEEEIARRLNRAAELIADNQWKRARDTLLAPATP